MSNHENRNLYTCPKCGKEIWHDKCEDGECTDCTTANKSEHLEALKIRFGRSY